MDTTIEWATLPSGQRGVVLVQKHVVGRSTLKRVPTKEGVEAGHRWGPGLTRHELRYERSVTDPNCYDIIEIRIREMIRESSNDKEERESDGVYTLLASGEDFASNVSSCNESNAVSQSCRDWQQQLSQEAAEGQGEGHGTVHASATVGRGQGSNATVPVSPHCSSTGTAHPPGLTAVRLLFQLSSPGYCGLLASNMDCLWIVRVCDDRERAFPKDVSVESVIELCKQAGVQPKLVRQLDYHGPASNCWLLELHSPHDGQLLAGKEREYTSFFDGHLYIWQKIKMEDFDKPTEWHIKSLPPYLAELSGEKLKQKIEDLDKDYHFRSLSSLQHDYLSGACVLRGIAKYQSSVSIAPFSKSTSFVLHDGVSKKVILNVECFEQCTFCGLDCSVMGDVNFHDAQTCPYKTILQRHKAQHHNKNTRK